MKNFGAILVALAAGASFVAALPASSPEHGVVARGQHYYALHVREPKHDKHGKNKGNGNANNATAIASPAANNGTANGDDNGKKHKNQGNGQDDAGNAAAADANAAGDNGILDALLGLLNGGAGGQGANAQAAAAAQNDPLAVLQGLLNGV
ncbi:hypothetical protein F4801DRAFT_348075 [Xylaria longipes]|nr:hypothetical protein F4801DRAFT_348075 [Xylaria longipes]